MLKRCVAFCLILMPMMLGASTVQATEDPHANDLRRRAPLPRASEVATSTEASESIRKYITDMKKKKLTVMVGGVRGIAQAYEPTMKGTDQSYMGVLSYEWNPKWSSSLMLIKGTSDSRSPGCNIRTQGRSLTVGLSGAYKLKEWLSLIAGFAKSTSTTMLYYRGAAWNPEKINAQTFAPYIGVSAFIPLHSKVFVTPSATLTRVYSYIPGHKALSGQMSDKKYPKVQQLGLNTMVGFVASPLAVPYVKVGCNRVLENTTSKTHHSQQFGAGVMVAGGAVTVDWTANTAPNYRVAHTVTVNMAMKF